MSTVYTLKTMPVSFEEEKLITTTPEADGGSSFARVMVKANVVRNTKEADTILLISSGIGLIVSASLFVMFTTSIQQHPVDVVAQQQQDGHDQRK